MASKGPFQPKPLFDCLILMWFRFFFSSEKLYQRFQFDRKLEGLNCIIRKYVLAKFIKVSGEVSGILT